MLDIIEDFVAILLVIANEMQKSDKRAQLTKW